MTEQIPAAITLDGFSVTSNTETADSMRQNFESAAEPKDKPTPEEKADREKAEVSEAAAKLGAKGGKAAAEAKSKPDTSKAVEDGDRSPESQQTAAEAKAEKDAAYKRSASARVQQALADKKAAEEKAAQLERMLAERSKGEKVEAKPAEKPADEGPKEEDFERYSDFVDARAEWKAEQKFKSLKAQEQQEAYAERYLKTVHEQNEKFQSAIDPHREELGDFIYDERFLPAFMLADQGRASEVTALSLIGDYVFRSKNPVDVIRHLRDHEDDFQRIATLQDPYEIRTELAMVEAGIVAAKKPSSAVASTGVTEKAVSKAHPPLKPVNGAPSAGDPLDDPDSLSFEEYVKRANAADKGRRSPGGRRL